MSIDLSARDALIIPARGRIREDDPESRETNFAHDGVRLLRRHKLLFLLAFLPPCALGLAIAFAMPSVYSASSTVQIETTGKDVVTLKEVLADVPADAEAITGEIEVLSAREMLERVATRLSLLDNPEFNPALQTSLRKRVTGTLRAELHRWLAGVLPSPATREQRPMNDVVDTLRRRLLIAPVGRSRVIQITASAYDPATAAAIVNTLAELYTEEHLRLRNDATRQANDWIDTRIADLRSRADRSAAAVEQYRMQHGLVRGRDSLLVEQEVTEVSTQLTAARGRRSQAEAALADADRARGAGTSDRISPVVNSPVIALLRQQEAQITARRADIDSHFGDAHPAVVAAAAQLRAVRAKIDAEVNRIAQGLREAANVARADEATLAARLDEVRHRVDSANTLTVGLRQLQREADVDNTLYQTFLTRFKETDPRFNFPTVNVRVLSRAVAPDHPAGPNRSLIGLAGLFAGLCAGVGASVAKDILGRGLRTRADVEKMIGLAPIGIIPHARRRTRPIQQMRLKEAVTALWARVIASSGGNAPRSILITSAVMGEGKTTLTRLLGAAAAQQGHRVLVIDADMRCSALSTQIRHRGPQVGLAEVIRGETQLEGATIAVDQNLDVLPAGDCGGNPVHLLASNGFTRFLQEAEQVYDVVLVDSPPVLLGADAWLLGRRTDATILVARWERTARTDVEAALRELLSIGVRCVGVVLSDVNVRKFALYDAAASLSVSWRARRDYANLFARK